MRILTGHRRSIYALAWSPDGSLLASGGDDQDILLWNARTGDFEGRLSAHTSVVRALCFSADARTLLSGGDDGAVLLWDVPNRTLARELLKRPQTRIIGVALNREGTRAVAGDELAFNDDQSLFSWGLAPQGDLAARRVGGVWCLAMNHDGTVLGVGMGSGQVSLVNSTTLQVIKRFRHSVGIRSLAFSSDGRTLVTSPGTPLHVWNLDTETLRGQLGEHKHLIESVAYHPDGRTLVAGAWDSSVRLYDTALCVEQGRYDFELGRVFTVAVAPDGMTAAAAGDSRNIVLLDIDP